MDFSAFSHGQIQSKLWLCEKIEPFLPENTEMAILGSWYNILGFMLLTRNENKFKLLEGIDIDRHSIQIADHIMQAWLIGYNHKGKNLNGDVNLTNLDKYNVIVNCSLEHMRSDNWYHNIKNQLICIQSSDVINNDPIWDINNPINNIDHLKTKYPMSQILFEGHKIFDYGNICYKRFMLIGYK